MTTEIKNRVNEIIAKYNPDRLSPFPYARVTEGQGDLTIEFVEFPEKTQHISGAILYDAEKQHFNILINKDNSKTRQYFTLAHELGHYFLHVDYLKSHEGILDSDEFFNASSALFRIDDADGDANEEKMQIEKEANLFAAYLTMPENLVRDAWSQINDIQGVAEVFQVSPIIMTNQLGNLNLIQE